MNDHLAVVHDGIRTPEGLVQVELTSSGEVLLKLPDDLLASSVECIDLLLDVANRDDGVTQQRDDSKLEQRKILELVHQEDLTLGLKIGRDLGMRQKQLQGIQKNVLHLERVCHLGVDVEELAQKRKILIGHLALLERILALNMAAVKYQ